MAFQNLRTGSTIYLFYKTNSPRLDVGQIINEPKFRQKYPVSTPGQPYSVGYMPQPQEQVIDLSIKIGEKIQPIEGLSPTSDIQDCGAGLFVSCSRDAINAEIASHMHNSEVAIASDTIAMHQQIISSCKDIMVSINPEIAERQKIEAENKELKAELREMKGMMATLLEQLGGPIKK